MVNGTIHCHATFRVDGKIDHVSFDVQNVMRARQCFATLCELAAQKDVRIVFTALSYTTPRNEETIVEHLQLANQAARLYGIEGEGKADVLPFDNGTLYNKMYGLFMQALDKIDGDDTMGE